MDRQVGPEHHGHHPLQEADPEVPADHVGTLVDQDIPKLPLVQVDRQDHGWPDQTRPRMARRRPSR